MSDSQRLMAPLMRDRRGEPLREVSWEEALDRVAQGFGASVRQHGPDSFGLFCCSKGTNEMNFIAGKLTRVALGSNNIDSCNRT